MTEPLSDTKYLNILLNRIAVCKNYKPKFGQGGVGIDYTEFRNLYSIDPLYAWFGLDHPLMYAAHKAAGGITSVYRQIGIGCEELFRQLLVDYLGLTAAQATWSYEITSLSGQRRILKLDGRIELAHLENTIHHERILEWQKKAAAHLDLDENIANAMRGIVMEVRQGYKSKDAKRQNADIANAAEAYTKGYLPVLIGLSTQIDNDIVARYERGKWLVLRGSLSENDLFSTYAFVNNVIGYDLAAFFERNAQTLRDYTVDVLESLLRIEPDDKTTG